MKKETDFGGKTLSNKRTNRYEIKFSNESFQNFHKSITTFIYEIYKIPSKFKFVKS